MSTVLSINDIVIDSSVTNITTTSFDKCSWVGDLVTNDVLVKRLLPSTKYYIHYIVKKIANPISHFYTTQSWGYTMLYNDRSSIGCIGLTKERYESMQIGESTTLSGTFTTPDSLSGWRLVFYSARYSGSSSDWGSNAELVPVRVCNFEVSDVPFTNCLSLSKSGNCYATTFNEYKNAEFTPLCINSNTFIEI